LTIYLFGADIPKDVYESRILSLPQMGTLYDMSGKVVGSEISKTPYTLTDPKHRVAYVPNPSITGKTGDGFNFAIIEGGVPVESATVTIHIMDNTNFQCSGQNATAGTGTGTMGEIKKIKLTHVENSVLFDFVYQNPVVVAQPLSWSERNEAAVARITQVNATGFTVRIQEGPSSDGNHSEEELTYLVIEAGSWRLSDGTRIVAGKVVTDATVGGTNNLDNSWEVVEFPSSTLFTKAPIVLTQVQTSNDFHWVKTRQKSITTSQFMVTLEEEEANEIAHGGEVVGWLAVEPVVGFWSGSRFEAAVESGVEAKWRDRWWHTMTFHQQFDVPPMFLAMLTTFDDPDPAHLRYRSLSKTGVDIRIEEDREQDWERQHDEEKVSYLALEHEGALHAIPADCYLIPTAYDKSFFVSPNQISEISLLEDDTPPQVFAVLLTLPKKGNLFQYQPESEFSPNKTIEEAFTVVEDVKGRLLYIASDVIDVDKPSGDYCFLYELRDDKNHTSNLGSVTIRVVQNVKPNYIATLKASSSTLMITLSVVGFTVAVLVAGFFVFFFYKRKKARTELEGFLSLSELVTNDDGSTTYFAEPGGNSKQEDFTKEDLDEDDD